MPLNTQHTESDPSWIEHTLATYRAALTRAALSEPARRAYASRVGGFLAWLAEHSHPDRAGDPLGEAHARDAAVSAYRNHLKIQRAAKPNTINAALTALDHFYAHHLGLGHPQVGHEQQPPTTPEALDTEERRRFLHTVERHATPRDRAIALVLLHTGLRVDELARLDVTDVTLSEHSGTVLVRPQSHRARAIHRELPLQATTRAAVHSWLNHRPSWPHAEDCPALWLNRHGGRLSVRSINTTIRELAVAADLVHTSGPDAGKARVHPHTLRHTFGAHLLRHGASPATIAALMGHAKIDSARAYTTHPTQTQRRETGSGSPARAE